MFVLNEAAVQGHSEDKSSIFYLRRRECRMKDKKKKKCKCHNQIVAIQLLFSCYSLPDSQASFNDVSPTQEQEDEGNHDKYDMMGLDT